MNKGTVWKSAKPCPFFTKSIDPPIFLLKSETTTTSRNSSVSVNAIVNFAQIVKEATCLMTLTQYKYSNKSLALELN